MMIGVDAFVSFSIERLGEYLIRYVQFLLAVKSEVEWLKEELKRLHCFINDAQNKQIYDQTVQQWVLEMWDIAYDCEDVLDEFIIKVHDDGIPAMLCVDQATTSELFTCLKNIWFCICRKVQEQIDLCCTGKQIKRIKGRLKDASDRREQYNLQDINRTEGESSAPLILNTLRRTGSFQFEEMNLVGRDDDTGKIKDQLLDKDKPERFVISIFGSPGMGKTTLAGKLYHHPEIKDNFTRRAWVSVSKNFDIKDLLQRIIRSLNEDPHMPELDTKSEAALEGILHQSLKGQSYLVVIDDIWHKEAWDCLKRAFPDQKNGSRVIMTTRNEDVAKEVDGSALPRALQPLGKDESWQLFCTKAFKNYQMDHELEQLGAAMVQKCAGLPLAIVVLGGLLATKKPNDWSDIRDDIWNNMVEHDNEITYLLDLSFDDLPSELKVCFLYLGLFPEDNEIKIRKLIRLWVAEGFILQKGEKTLEELAEDYLNGLINRSLIQTGLISRGRIFTCRVHDLLRHFAIRKAKELNLICTKHEAENSAESSKSRRHALYLGEETSLLLQDCNPRSHSLLFYDQHFLSLQQPNLIEDLLQKVCSKFRVARVIDLNYCYFTNSRKLPEEIGKLIHLKYLGLRNTTAFSLPSSIGKLLSLQTLELPTQLSYRLQLQIPSEIGMLTELRHLIGRFGTKLQIDNLTKLQTLKTLRGLAWTQVNTENLVNLRELRITKYFNQGSHIFTFDSIANLKSLRILSIALIFYCSFDSLEPLSHCKHLQDLNLEGKLQNLPENLHELVKNLECLSLDGSELEDDPMPKLEKLPRLTHLQLGFDSYRGSKMTCSARHFGRLEILKLCPKPQLNEWEVENGALPVLKDLHIIVHPDELEEPTILSSIETLNLSARVHVERDTICRL